MYFNKQFISILNDKIPLSVKRLNLKFKDNPIGWVRFNTDSLVSIYIRQEPNDDYYRPILKFDYIDDDFIFKYIYFS